MQLLSNDYIKIIIYLSAFTNICYGEGLNHTADEKLEPTVNSSNDGPFAIASRQSGRIRFEDEPNLYSETEEDSDFNDRRPGQPFKFEENNSFNDNYINNDNNLQNNHIGNDVTFQDDNRVEDHNKKKRKKRRRKPKFQRPPNGSAYPINHQQFPPGYAPQGEVPFQGYPLPVQPYPGYGLQVNAPGQNFGPYRPPQQSFVSDALSTVTRALTSIALYDDYQCVPRLLCEAAGGGNLGSLGVLQSVSGLQPLLTMLSTYSRISNSPLFVFGRAVFVGMTNKENPRSCYDTYSQCPSDPEKVVHYLNNHNGGFFRFFNAPHLQNPQNIQQFYNQLSIPNQQQILGQYEYQNNQANSVQYNNIYPPQNYVNTPLNQQGFGIQNPYYSPQQVGPQGYGFYNPSVNEFHHQNQINYGYNQQYSNNGITNPNLINPYTYPPNFGSRYPNQNYRFKNRDQNETNEIQRRIQVKPDFEFIETNVKNTGVNHKFVFSDNNRLETKPVSYVRNEKSLKFPDDNSQKQHINNNDREKKTLVFPEFYKKEINNSEKYPNTIDEELVTFYQTDIDHGVLKDYSRDYNYGAIDNVSQINNNHVNAINEEVHTVYIVRGNSDPNNPEIVHVKPGEKVHF